LLQAPSGSSAPRLGAAAPDGVTRRPWMAWPWRIQETTKLPSGAAADGSARRPRLAAVASPAAW